MAKATFIEAEDFQKLTLLFVIVTRMARSALSQRIDDDMHKPLMDDENHVSAELRKTVAVASLEADPLAKAEEAYAYLAERALNADLTLDLTDAHIARNMGNLMDAMGELKGYFRQGSGYSVRIQLQETKAIDDFLRLAQTLGINETPALRRA